ncbi:MAG: hypothetical protein A3K19_07710 [Lentisphaerae bacterium RIFOXYB12_FULL_65_16]|nr:MAG: hypothetical protein A3K18_07435 [Lentisphaerae bacterium RIFOXYA12_64_32]OGV87534.1 MAG: hypothetical protein A3K19_07710 [Lentisphaerae bacterium RIFOXYB12_FULL_65_16]
MALGFVLAGVLTGTPALAQTNLVANPDFEVLGENGFFSDWADGEFGKVGKTLFVETQGAHSGKTCLRTLGTASPTSPWTTCAGKPIAVKPETTYWITWWFKAQQPPTSRTYLFLQTNQAQRVFRETDRVDAFDWTFNIVGYRTQTGETTLHPVLTMMTAGEQVGTAWWDEIGVWEKLPPDMEAAYRREHPWDDTTVATARSLAQTESCRVWGDRPEVRIYLQQPPPTVLPAADGIALTAPGGGHDLYQLAVTATQALEPLTLEFGPVTGPAEMPASSLRYRVARCVPVQEVRDKNFPLGPTPDPLLDPTQPEPVKVGESTLFWVEWAPPPGGAAGQYQTAIRILAGGKPLATVPLRLRRWGFELPEQPHYRSMVLFSSSEIRRFYPGMSDDDAMALGWDILSAYRLSGFNLAVWPTPTLRDGQLEIDWARFDRILEAAKKYKASAITLGPMFGGGCSEGWKPRVKFAGFTALADAGFDAVYVEFNRRMAERLRTAGLLDKAYVYPYDESEADYFDKIARLCDLIHQGAPDLKVLQTITPVGANALWGKVNAWICPGAPRREVLEQRRAAGDEIWLYNMIAGIENTPLSHRLWMWQVLKADARGGLLWNAAWWHKINPWENPTAAAYPVGRNGDQLYRYQAGEASLFYPDPAGKGPLIPSLRLLLIRQGVEDFDIVTELTQAWRSDLDRLAPKAKELDAAGIARAAIIAPVMLSMSKATDCGARAEALRLLAGNELEAARQQPTVLCYPIRDDNGQLAISGFAEPGTQLTLNGAPVALDADGRFSLPVSDDALATGMAWTAENAGSRKTWAWPGVR